MNLVLVFGIVLLLGFLFGRFGHKTRITGIVGYILLGIILGPELLGIVNLSQEANKIIFNIVLSFVSFIIGTEISKDLIKKLGKGTFMIILGETYMAFLLVFLAIYLYTHNLALSLLLGAISSASAPAGTVAVIQEYRAKGLLTSILLLLVGIDDALTIINYTIVVGILKGIYLRSLDIFSSLMPPLTEISVSILIGILLGILFIKTIRIFKNDRESIFILTTSSIILCSGLSLYFNLSPLISTMSMGIIFINLAPGITRVWIENSEMMIATLYIVFFTLIGTHLRIELLLTMGIIGILYVIFRTIGLIGGAYIGGLVGKVDKRIRKWVGFGILCQAGVCMGLSALIAGDLYFLPNIGNLSKSIISLLASTSILFEVVGPVGVKFALTKTGEIS